jgi:hypothetical protein
MYRGTPITRPTMGSMSDGRVTGVVASVKLKIWGWISPHTVVSLACIHDWSDVWSPFHDKNSYFLEKDDSDISIIIKFIILSWVCILGTKYLLAEPIRYNGRTYPISKGIRLAFIFCCTFIRSWMGLHVRIKTYFLPVFYLITPEHLHLLTTI